MLVIVGIQHLLCFWVRERQCYERPDSRSVLVCKRRGEEKPEDKRFPCFSSHLISRNVMLVYIVVDLNSHLHVECLTPLFLPSSMCHNWLLRDKRWTMVYFFQTSVYDTVDSLWSVLQCQNLEGWFGEISFFFNSNLKLKIIQSALQKTFFNPF